MLVGGGDNPSEAGYQPSLLIIKLQCFREKNTLFLVELFFKESAVRFYII